MDKGFDGAAWASKHDTDFQNLIAEARQKAKSQKKPESSSEDRSDAGPTIERRPEEENAQRQSGGADSSMSHTQVNGGNAGTMSR